MKRLTTGANLNPTRVPALKQTPPTPLTAVSYDETVLDLSRVSPKNQRNKLTVGDTHLVFSNSPQHAHWTDDDSVSKKSRDSTYRRPRGNEHRNVLDASTKVRQWKDVLNKPDGSVTTVQNHNGYQHHDASRSPSNARAGLLNGTNGISASASSHLGPGVSALFGVSDVATSISTIQEILKTQEAKINLLRKHDQEKDERIQQLERQLKYLAAEQGSPTRAQSASAISDGSGFSDQKKTRKKNKKKTSESEVDPLELERVNTEMIDSDSEDSLEGHAKMEVMYENYRIEREKRKQRIKEVFDEHYKEWCWSTVSPNAFGAFIHLSFQEGFKSALKQAGLMVMVAFSTQWCITFYLWEALDPIFDAPGHCTNPTALQLSAIGVWLLVMMTNIPFMQNNASIVLFCSAKKNKADMEMSNPVAPILRVMVFIYAVASELLVWSFLLTVGCQFILTAGDSILIVRSTVAITFINNIDEMIYASCAPGYLREEMTNTKYKLNHASFYCGLISDRKLFEIETVYGKYLHLPVLFVASFILAVFLRTSFFDCPDMWVQYQGQHSLPT